MQMKQYQEVHSFWY